MRAHFGDFRPLLDVGMSTASTRCSGGIESCSLSRELPKCAESRPMRPEKMMQSYAHSPASQARAILCALQTNDHRLLQTELDRVDGVPEPTDPAECERLELLFGIAKELQLESEPFASNNAAVYRGLLQHLAASSNGRVSGAAVTAWASGSRSVRAATLLQ